MVNLENYISVALVCLMAMFYIRILGAGKVQKLL